MRESTNFKRLADALEVTPPSVTGIVDHLVEHGMVSRQENPENRRMQTLRVTDKGKALILKLREGRVSHIAGILAHLTSEELSTLSQGLKALNRAASAQHSRNKDMQEA